MINNIIDACSAMGRKRKKTWFGRLLDKEDNTTSMSSFIIFIVLTVAVILLAVPAFSLVIEAWFNHTVASDISGWAAYIGAVCSLIVTICGLKYGINNTDRKYPVVRDPFGDYGSCEPTPHAVDNDEFNDVDNSEEQIINEDLES